MKKIFTVIAALAALSLASCNKPEVQKSADGFISFADLSLECDDDVVTKAKSAASSNYTIIVTDSDDVEVLRTTYGAVKSNDNKISLSAGTYTITARSTEEAVPVAEFEQPVYGASKQVTVQAGETTPAGSMTCTLLQCKVTVAYSDEFLAMVTGNGSAKVSVTSGYDLTYDLNYTTGAVSYEQSAGYFAVNNGSSTTMEVVFSGNIEGKSAKMTKTFTGIQPRQWRQVKFIKKANEQGNATFDIVIDDYVDDEALNNNLVASEEPVAEDPDAPKGDGGITVSFAEGTSACFTDLNNLLIPAPADPNTPDVCLRLNIKVPNGLKKFNVLIESTSEAFTSAVEAAEATNLDLINPTETNMIIFQVVPFPHGHDIIGQTDLTFDLSMAQCAIFIYPGRHQFKMVAVDNQGCKKEIPVVMVVE